MLQPVLVECPVLEDLYKQKDLVSLKKASVTIYWLAEEEHKIASMTLADSLGLGVSHADRKLCRQKTQGKPWGFFKMYCSEHLLQSSAKSTRRYSIHRGDEICEFIKSGPAFISFPYSTLPVFVFYRPRAAQVRVKARAGWCFCERDNEVNNPRVLVHLTSTAYKSTNSRRPQRSQGGK